MRNTIVSFILLSVGLTACAGIKRGPDQYRDDTRSLLETRNTQVKACYDNALAADPELDGKVVVDFNVGKKTGVIYKISVDEEKSTAPPALQNCIVKAIDGLKLDPVDRKEGDAEFTWVFTTPVA